MPRFSVDRIHEQQNFLSLLYYLGLVTVDRDENSGMALLKIPNYTIKTMYWGYMENKSIKITRQGKKLIKRLHIKKRVYLFRC